MTSPPPGVQGFDPSISKQAAASNFTVSVHGGPKAGKSHFAFNSERPLYVVYLDANPNIHQHMLKSSQKYGDEVYYIIISPLNGKKYADFTLAEAEEILDKIEQFRDWAVMHALERKLEGKHGGTFIVDGMIYFKGYLEKAILGESVTLGWRPKRGESTDISTFDYAKTNGAIFEFVSSFVNQPLDAIFVWEGRPVYKDVLDGRGRVQSKRTDAWRSTRPDRMPFGLSAEVEALKVLERLNPADNQSPLLTIPKLRIILSADTIGMDQMVIPAKEFADFKRMMLEPTTGDLDELARAVPAAAVLRANDVGMNLTEISQTPVKEDDDDD